jgi:hypothetical protein
MRIINSLSLFGIASANDCASFCDAQLGAAICKPVGTYCKNEYACHGIFWTSNSKSEICIQGASGCTSQIPVLCTEASSSTSQTDEPVVSTTRRRLLRQQIMDMQYCGESYVPPAGGETRRNCPCCPDDSSV